MIQINCINILRKFQIHIAITEKFKVACALRSSLENKSHKKFGWD